MTDGKSRTTQVDWLRRHLGRLEVFGLQVTETTARTDQTGLSRSRYNQNEGSVEIEQTALDAAVPRAAFAKAQHAAYRVIGAYLLCGPEGDGTAGGPLHPRRDRTGSAPPCLAQADARGRHPALQYVLRIFADRRMAGAHGPNWQDGDANSSAALLAPSAGRAALPWLPSAQVETEAARLARDLEDALGEDLQQGPWCRKRQ